MNTARLGVLDWTLIAAYILLVVGMSIRTKLQKRQNAEEFLVAHKSMNWMVVAVAVFATLFSTISFVSIPGEAYNYGLTLMVAMLAQILVLPLAIWLFLRFFFNAPTFTAYEYLERRFDRKCRVTGAAIFITIRLFYTGTVFYAASVIFESLVGWPAPLTIAVIGAVTVLYTVLGGAKAVIFADVLQSVIIFVGIGAILYKVLQATGFDFGGIYGFAQRHEHTFELFTKPSFYRLDVHDRWNFWLIMIGVITGPLTTLSCDQLVIQRLLAGKNYQQAKKSMYTNYLISVPVITMLFGIGLCLYFYYQAGDGKLPAGTGGDQVLGYFISTELPAPLPGLIVTALLAALMSTVAGAVNSLVTVFWKDIALAYAPHWGGTPREINSCKHLTVFFGILSLSVALLLFFAGQNVRTTVVEVTGVWASLWTILLAVFLHGVLSPRVSARAAFISMLISGAIGLVFPYIMYYAVAPEQRWGYTWLMLPGFIAALVLPPLLSLRWPNRKSLAGLTVRNLDGGDGR